MNSLFCLFLIILIIFISYNCYNPIIEGQTNPGPAMGDYTGAGTGPGLPPSSYQADNSCGPGTPCAQYKEKDCYTETITGTAKSNWIYGRKGDKPDTATDYKTKCMTCIQGSQKQSSTQRALANIGYQSNSNKSSFYAMRVCDAMAADCDSPAWYGNSHAEWGNYDCRNVSITDTNISATNRMLCSLVSNSIIQFFLSFLSGVTCTLKIKALELEQTIESAGKCLICSACQGTVNPIPCPDGCDECN